MRISYVYAEYVIDTKSFVYLKKAHGRNILNKSGLIQIVVLSIIPPNRENIDQVFRTDHQFSSYTTEFGNKRALILHYLSLYKAVAVNEPQHDKTNKVTCAPSEDSDQPRHPARLIRVFAVPSIRS